MNNSGFCLFGQYRLESCKLNAAVPPDHRRYWQLGLQCCTCDALRQTVAGYIELEVDGQYLLVQAIHGKDASLDFIRVCPG